jgi:hypothetical protein
VATLRGRSHFFMIRFRNFTAAALSRLPRDHRFQSLAFMIKCRPEIAELAVDLQEDLIQMATPLGEAAHVRYPLLRDLRREKSGPAVSTKIGPSPG